MLQLSRLRRVTLGISVCALTLLGVHVQAASADAPTCVPDQTTPGSSVKFDNCSSLPASTLLALLNGTDAAAGANLMSSTDEFFANSQWLGWIDRHDSPGILRGLWPINSVGQFQGTFTNGTYRSLVYPYTGFGSANAPYGYRGLYTEIWTKPEASGGIYFTYKNGPQSPSFSSSLSSSEIVRAYSAATLFSPATNGSVFTGGTGATATLKWGPTYSLTPSVFNVTTTLSATADVNFTGDAGGLSTLINPVCQRPVLSASGSAQLYGGCDPNEVMNTGLHVVRSSVSAVDLCGQTTDATTCAANVTRDSFRCFSDKDAANCGERPSASGWDVSLGPSATSTYQLIASPGWNLAGDVDPTANPQTRLFAYHFNYMPSSDKYFSGWGSLDVAYRGDSITNGQVLGPTRGYMQFGVNFSH